MKRPSLLPLLAPALALCWPLAAPAQEPPAAPLAPADDGVVAGSGFDDDEAAVDEGALAGPDATFDDDSAVPVEPAAIGVEAAPPPLLGDRAGLWGTPQLMYRARGELRDGADLAANADDSKVVGLQRVRLGLALNYADWLETLAVVQDARFAGYGNSSVAYTGNTDLHQGYAQVRFGATGLALKLGRQQLVYGAQRLIGHLEWANQGRVFDAAKLGWTHPLGQLDGFAAVFAPQPDGNLLDATHFFGLYDTLALFGGALVLDQYLLGLVDTGAALPAGQVAVPDVAVAAPQRQVLTIGTRGLFQGLGLHVDMEVAYQLGLLHAADRVGHSAFALHGDARYTLPLPLSPFVGIEANYATGDDASTETQSERFINLFPTNHMHYGAMDLQGWSNALNGALRAGLALGGLSLRLDYWLHARASADDGWYDAGGRSVLAASAAPDSEELLLGHELDGALAWKASDAVRLESGLGLFLPAGFALELGSDPQLWGYAMLIVSL